MALPGIPIPETQCIGDSLWSINNALTALDAAGASVTVSTTPPGGATLGDLWYDSDNGILSVYYDSQWVDVGAGGGRISDVTGTSPITVTGTDVKNVSVNVQLLTAVLDDYFVSSSTFNAPVGYVGYYCLSSAPTGWVECNGAAITVAMGSTYTNLRTLLINANNPFGVSGSDPKVPDLRGKFIRSNGSDGTYSSATFGTTQADDFQSHSHGFSVTGLGVGGSGAYAVVSSGPTGALSVNATGSTETRPANIALLACIKL